MRNSCRQFAPVLRPSLARSFGRSSGPKFNSLYFIENLSNVLSKVGGCFLCILLYCFLQKILYIDIYVSSFLLSLKTLSVELVRVGILRRVIAMV